MEIKLRSNSWHGKLYKWTYAAYVLPSSLCNYFWALLFAIASIPLTVWSLPHHWARVKPENYLIRLSQSLFTLVVILILIGLVACFIKDPIKSLVFTAKVIAVVAAIIGGVFLYFGIQDGRKKIIQTDTYQIVSGQAFSVKKKICPKINWK